MCTEISQLIYLVDDDADYRFLVQQVFRMFLPHHQVRFFSSGVELVSKFDSLADHLHTITPRTIVLDIDMPGLNGFETLLKIKQQRYWQQIPIIMMTNRDMLEFRQQSLRLGASAFLLKPLDLLSIKDVMTKICNHEGDFAEFFPL